MFTCGMMAFWREVFDRNLSFESRKVFFNDVVVSEWVPEFPVCIGGLEPNRCAG